jgi:poly-gamma-glutamate synthesis protein (capsule biosynthesis protein)
LYHDGQIFLSAIALEKPTQPVDGRVSGVGVPHHLLAANLIARGLWVAAHNSYERIVVLAPDHYSKSRRPFAVTRRDFETPFGRLQNDRSVTDSLLLNHDLFDESDLFEKEHGVQAVLPFLKHFFPAAKIVSIAASYSSNRTDWNRAVQSLKDFTDLRTLVVQSTDYSHKLPLANSIARDQETLNVLASGDLESLNGLVQPDHLDSKAAQYIQMRLQREIYKATATVISNRDSSEYGATASSVTSYVVTVYSPDSEVVGSRLRYGDQNIVLFGGDTFVGRWFSRPLADPTIADKLIGRIRAATGGAPLVVNLEGVPLHDPPLRLPNTIHAMYAELAIRILKSLNVKAVSLANNHSYDLGNRAFEESVSLLKRAQIKPLRHMQPDEVGQMGIVAINFIGANDDRGYPVIRDNADLQELCAMQARPPLIAFVHWGKEYRRDISPDQHLAADALHRCGVGLIIGAHSHSASLNLEAKQGGEYQMLGSLGNLLFDQRGRQVSSTLLEVRRFAKGTIATRLIPMPNLYERASGRITGGQMADEK